MGLLLRSIAPSATIMIFSLFIPARFYKEGWWRNSMTEKLRRWLWHGLSEAWGPDGDNCLGSWQHILALRHRQCHPGLCLHFKISTAPPTLLLVITTVLWAYRFLRVKLRSFEIYWHQLSRQTFCKKLLEMWFVRRFGICGSGDWYPAVRSPCFWLPLSLHSGTHILDKTRGYRLPVPVNGSLCNYDYVQPCAPRTGLNRRTITFFSKEKSTVRYQRTKQSSVIQKSGLAPCKR